MSEKKSTKLLVAEALEASASELERIRALQVEAEDRAGRRHTELVALLIDLRTDVSDLRRDLVQHRTDTDAEFRRRPVLINGQGHGSNGASRG